MQEELVPTSSGSPTIRALPTPVVDRFCDALVHDLVVPSLLPLKVKAVEGKSP